MRRNPKDATVAVRMKNFWTGTISDESKCTSFESASKLSRDAMKFEIDHFVESEKRLLS